MPTNPREFVVITDERGEAELPGHPNQEFLMREQSDGSIMLTPVNQSAPPGRSAEAGPTVILPLSSETMALLIRVAFMWDVSPQTALNRALRLVLADD
jgi:hypothetical protein